MTRTSRGRCATAALVGAVSLVLAACGSDAGDGSTAPVGVPADGELVVVAEDIAFPRDTYRAAAGTIDVVYENEGRIVHTLVIEGLDDFELEVASRGDVAEGSIDLEPGSYEMYCDVPGHRQAGMEATLEVS